MKLSTLLAHTCLYVSTVRAVGWELTVLVPEPWEDDAVVSGKQVGYGEIVNMTRASYNPKSMGVCEGKDNPGDDCKLYHGVTRILFTQPTKDPRPISITFSDTVSQCNISVSLADEYVGGSVYWYMGWGLSRRTKSDLSPLEIVCEDSTRAA